MALSHFSNYLIHEAIFRKEIFECKLPFLIFSKYFSENVSFFKKNSLQICHIHLYVSLHVIYPLYLPECRWIWSFSTYFVKISNNFFIRPMEAQLFEVESRMDGQPLRNEYWFFGNVRNAWCSWISYLYKIFTRHGLTFCGIEGTDFDNDVTVVVNCYDGGSPTPLCCKCDICECNFIEKLARI